MLKHFGAKATKEELEGYSKSNNWDGKSFSNLVHTSMDIGMKDVPKLLYKQFFENKGRSPKFKLPVISFDKEAFLKPSSKAKFIWYGHSVILLRLNNKTILLDPMLGSNAAPISPIPVTRFSENTLDLIPSFPEIDLALLTHDHYDHLDFDSIKLLKSKVKQFYVAIGVKRHLVKWGVDANIITEFDWWQKESFEDIDITFTPTRHFSGRGISDRAKSLWGGWVFKTNTENIWFSGDGGYGDHFKEVGDKLGPFDFGFMECGQYNKLWQQIHLFPEESVQAALDAQVKSIMPVHWAGFALAQHSWTEPIERFVAEADKQKMDYITPQIGQLIDLELLNQTTKWWEGE